MKNISLLAALLALPLALQAEDAPDIKTSDLGGGAYHLTLTSTSIKDPDMAHYAMLPAAAKLCGEETPQFGHYKYDSQQRLDDKTGQPDPAHLTFVLEQDIRCVAPGTQTSASPLPDPNYRYTDADEQTVESDTKRFFAAKDSGDYMASYALLDPGMKDLMSFQHWMEITHQSGQATGPALSRRLVKVSWSKNPPNAPGPGVYAVVDYTGRFQNADIQCGYLVWHQQPDGSFLLGRDEQGFLTKEQQQKMTPEQISAMKTQFGCVGD